jgi:hypothetical protein
MPVMFACIKIDEKMLAEACIVSSGSILCWAYISIRFSMFPALCSTRMLLSYGLDF